MSLLDLDFTTDITEALKASAEAFAANVSAYVSYVGTIVPNSAEYQQLEHDKEEAIAEAKQAAADRDAALAADTADKAANADLQAKLAASEAKVATLQTNLQQALGLAAQQDGLLKGLLDKAGIPAAGEAPVAPTA